MAANDRIDHPSHYRADSIEAIDVIEAWELNFSLGNVVKYVCRAGLKSDNALEDLRKALWYLEREVDRITRIQKRSRSGEPGVTTNRLLLTEESDE
jgi:hypothetical protein